MSEYKIFYNPDCGKWGILADNKQILLVGAKDCKIKDYRCYTRYKGVAERWLNDLKAGRLQRFGYSIKGD